MKCQRQIISMFLLFLITISAVNATFTERTIKKIKFRKWFSKKLFDQATGKFDKARQKVDQAKEMILLAKGLVHEDKEHAINKGENINNLNTFEQLIISKLGHWKDLSNFDQFILGFLVGDLLPKFNKGLAKENALTVISCIKEKFEKKLNETESQIFFHNLSLKQSSIDKDAVKGYSSFDNNVSNLKNKTQAIDLLGSEVHLKKFLETARKTTITIAKYVNENLNNYGKCLEEMQKTNERKKSWEKVLETKLNFEKTYECQLDSDDMLVKLIEEKNTIGLIKNLWNVYIKNELIERNKKVNWYKTGLSAAGIRSTLIKPLCISGIKEKTKKQWNSRYFKK